MPRSRAALAMTGAAPVPVPPHDFGHARARLSDNGAPARHGERGEQTAPLSYPLPCPGSGGCSGGSVWLQPPNAPQILAWSTGAVLHPHRANRCHWKNKKQTRSEEHTSELQSLMRISYAVFCLKNKNQ